MARFYKHRRWWYSTRVELLWSTFRGCVNFERHFTWRDA